MAAIAHLRREERLGLGVAMVAHVSLFAALLWHASREPAVVPPAERMSVSLAEDVSLESTAPDPSDVSQAAVAPVLAPEPEPAPQPVPTSDPVRRPVERTIERPTPRPSPTQRPEPRQTSQPAGGSRLGDDFLRGAGSGDRSDAGSPAAVAGPAEQASIASAMIRQIKPHWSAPQGADAELLVTILDWDLNPDGSLRGRPRLVRQLGINDSNRPQAALHAERAIRAVQLAAPFRLPEEYYNVWKSLRGIRFDRNL